MTGVTRVPKQRWVVNTDITKFSVDEAVVYEGKLELLGVDLRSHAG